VKDVIYERDRGVSIIRMNRPDRLNALGQQMKIDLRDAWQQFLDDDSARVAILTGSGRAFCAGRDIKEQNEGVMGNFTQKPDRPPHYWIPRVEKPTIAAVNGLALGVGCFMACGTDLRIMSEDAELGFPELPTAILGPWDLAATQMIPWAIACELALLGQRISARRAYEIGLANRVVAADELESSAREMADQLAALPPKHLVAMLRLTRKTQFQPSAELMREADGVHTELLALGDTAEAARAFVDKRKADFKGR
jgi:enoyl-CoA hydratase/carnithine racemase